MSSTVRTAPDGKTREVAATFDSLEQEQAARLDPFGLDEPTDAAREVREQAARDLLGEPTVVDCALDGVIVSTGGDYVYADAIELINPYFWITADGHPRAELADALDELLEQAGRVRTSEWVCPDVRFMSLRADTVPAEVAA